MAVYGVSSTSGPPLALVMTGYIAMNLGWRDNVWIVMGILGGFWILLVATLPETRHTTILDRKTKRVRKLVEKQGLNATNITDANADQKKGLGTLFKITLSRPFVFLFTEPITYASAIYNGTYTSDSPSINVPSRLKANSRIHLRPRLHLQRSLPTRLRARRPQL